MLRKAGLILVALATWALAGGAVAWGQGAAAAREAAQIWVSPAGDDGNPGTHDRPLLSPERALRNARELRRGKDPSVEKGIRIILEGGTYFLAGTLRIHPEDSGTAESPTIFEAAPGEFPVLSGAGAALAWQQLREAIAGLPAAAVGHVWVAQAPAGAGEIRQLWIDSRKATRARTPNGDVCERLVSWDPKKQEAGVPAAVFASLKNPAGAEMILQQQWEIAILRIKTVRMEGDHAIVTFQSPESTIEFEHPWPQPILPPAGGGAFFAANAIEFLDEPGEWFEEMPGGRVIYWPRAGEDLAHATCVAASLETLVEVAGDADHPVSNVSFKGIAFEHASWRQPSKTGHVPLQAGMRLVESYKLRPKGTEYSAGLDNQDWIERLPAAVKVRGAAHIQFEGCRFEHLAAAGLDFGTGTHDSVIEGNLFRDIGGNALQLGSFQEGPVETHVPYNPTDPREICAGVRIANNLVTDAANEDWGCVGICVGYARGIAIEHNEVSNTSYTGVSVGWGWTPLSNALRDNHVQANYIHHIATRMCDTGGVYTLSAQPGTIVSGNRIEDIHMSPYVDRPDHWFYLYTDEGSSGITLRDNWIPDEKKILKNANGPGDVFENNGPGVADAIKNAAGLAPDFRELLDAMLKRQTLFFPREFMPASDLQIVRLRCEYLAEPLGIHESAPRLNWALESERRRARQMAYRVLVASSRERLERGDGDLWDSGHVQSDQTTHIRYAGRALRSRMLCYWNVEVWDETGASRAGAAAKWSMGLLEKSDWKAQWIAADPQIIRRDREAIAPTLIDPGTPALFRKAFHIPSEGIKRATLYVTARGLVEIRLASGGAGKRIGEDHFVPEWTDYDKRIHYRTYDITAQMGPGDGVLSATLGDGWWSGYVGWQETRGRYGSLENSFLVQMEVELHDGRTETICTDQSWQCNTGPILCSDFMMGETYDARRERVDWDNSAFVADDSWPAAHEVPPPPVPLVPQPSEPVRITELLVAKSCRQIRPGIFIFDLGQNITGWVRLKIPANLRPGTRLQLRHGERLNPDGTLYTENLRRAKATDVYIANGGEAVWEPHFTFHGFQYVELSGLPSGATPDISTVTGCVIHSAMEPAGHFECSDPGVNRLWENGLWSQRDNFLCIPTDCPQRDERLGWMGDAQVFLRTATYNMNVAAFFTKWMIDVEDAQTPEGIFPDVAPRLREGKNFVGLGNLCGSAGWADAGVIVPYTLWRVYGDDRLIERHWPAMTRWLDYLERTNPNGLRLNQLGNNYGDWLCIPSDTSFGTHSPMKNFLATAYWANDARMMARMAQALGRETEARRFSAMFEKIRAAIAKEWLLADGQLAVETQTAYLLALAFDLLPENVRARAADRLVDNIKNLDWHLSTGFIGISHLNPQLTLSGHSDVAYKLLLRDDYPSWLYPVRHGATTIWERWNGWTQPDGFFNPQMNSFNHYSLGSVGEWLFRHMAGIELDGESNGFKHFTLRPFLPKKTTGLTFAKASYQSQHGEILSHWIRTGPALENLEWTIRIPPNTTARVYVPSDPDTEILESGVPMPPGIRAGRSVIYEMPPGRYSYRSTCVDQPSQPA